MDIHEGDRLFRNSMSDIHPIITRTPPRLTAREISLTIFLLFSKVMYSLLWSAGILRQATSTLLSAAQDRSCRLLF
ncbi:MAG TPA: hypothetical protein DCZ94_01160 [Lentisphaeria bacterium]|nr:hypothetical protein [Lentisphaeria bacterium]